MTDHYATLGVSRTAAADEIKQAFRKLASQHHPDKGGDTRKFQEIQAAYAVLGDTAARADYDNPRQQFGGFTSTGGHPFDLNNIFNMFTQGGFPSGQQQQRRNHARMSLWISLADAIRGGSKTVAVTTSAGNTTVNIDIPPGIDDGDHVQYGGVAPGGLDLVIQFRITPDPIWRRDGVHLHSDHKVDIWHLITGGDVEIRTAQGKILTFSIPPKTQPGTVMRLRAQGIHNRAGAQGDALIRLQAEIPSDIPEEIMTAIRTHKTA
jgi:DnaJ-class molecular chaperone